jgi:hypothetical protein
MAFEVDVRLSSTLPRQIVLPLGYTGRLNQLKSGRSEKKRAFSSKNQFPKEQKCIANRF